jgi:colanic acid biosynthesis glycosyl transferase WcaI
MKILLVAPYFPPEGGAASHLYYELGKALLARGHEISVLTGIPRYHVVGPRRTYRGPVQKEIFQGMQVYRVFNLDVPRNFLILRGLEEFISALSYGLAGVFLTEFDIALVHSPPLPLALVTLCMARLRGKAAVLNVHDIFPQCGIDLGILTNPLLIKFFRALESFLYRHFDLNMSNSEDNKQFVISRGGPPDKVTAVYHWVNTEEIKPSPRDNSLRKKLSLKHQFVVSFAGLMGVSQDLDTVLAVAGLLRDYQEIAFLLVGDGVEKPRLERMAQKAGLANVHFLPMLPKEEYPLVLAASDLCLVTLRSTLRTPVVPSKIMSIMAAGRPVLGSVHLGGEAARLIEASQGGISVPPENPQEMARAILSFYLDRNLGKTMGNKGRRYVEQHHSMNVTAAKIEKLFATILANRKPAQI